MEKTCGTPLSDDAHAAVQALIARAVPDWAALPLRQDVARPGCLVGPGKVGKTWGRAAARFRGR
eukprot:1401983-Pyramimonas_sp.AAC.1